MQFPRCKRNWFYHFEVSRSNKGEGHEVITWYNQYVNTWIVRSDDIGDFDAKMREGRRVPVLECVHSIHGFSVKFTLYLKWFTSHDSVSFKPPCANVREGFWHMGRFLKKGIRKTLYFTHFSRNLPSPRTNICHSGRFRAQM